MAGARRPDAKASALRARGALNPRPHAVTDPLFVGQGFFDARDLVQVKYEMLRRVQADGQSVRAARLAPLVRERFALRVHPRSIERALARGKKNGAARRARGPATPPG